MRVLIVGSCVTRDAFELPDAAQVVHDYFARTSLASATCDRQVIGVDINSLESRFQRRIVGRDLEKSLVETIGLSGWDLLLHDAIDERFDLLVGPDGEIATRSNELVATGWRAADFRRIEAGSLEHIALWERGWMRLVNVLSARRRLGDLRINRAFWALSDEEGIALEGSALARAQRANDHLERLYERMAEDIYPWQFYTYSDGDLRSATEHRWGRSPFHYVSRFYERMLSQLTADYPGRGQSMAAPRKRFVIEQPPPADLNAGADATPSEDRVLNFRGRHVVYTVHRRPDSRRLVLVFPGIDATPGATRPSYLGLGRILDATVVHVSDAGGAHGSYLLSVAGDEMIRNGVLMLIRELQKEFDCAPERTWFVGTSKGATCAIAYAMMAGGGRVVCGEPQIAIGEFLYGEDPQPEWARAIAYAMRGRVDTADAAVLDGLLPRILHRYAPRFAGTISVHVARADCRERHVEPLLRALDEADRLDCVEVVDHTSAPGNDIVRSFVDAVRRELAPFLQGDDAMLSDLPETPTVVSDTRT